MAVETETKIGDSVPSSSSWGWTSDASSSTPRSLLETIDTFKNRTEIRIHTTLPVKGQCLADSLYSPYYSGCCEVICSGWTVLTFTFSKSGELKPATHLAILYADRRDRWKSPGMSGATIAIFTDHRDRRIIADIWHVRYWRLNSPAFAKCARSRDFLRLLPWIASKANPSGWAILSHEFWKLPHCRDRRKKSSGVSASIGGENRLRSAYKIATLFHFVLLRDYFNSLNFYRNGEQSRNQIGRSGVQVKKRRVLTFSKKPRIWLFHVAAL